MARFYLPPASLRGKSFILSGSEAHHALHVLRKKIGDEIDLFDGKDASYKGRIDHIGSNEIQGTLVSGGKPLTVPVQLNLFQALTRATKWEWLIEKACEIGAARVSPIVTRRTLIKLTEAQAKEKQKRWNRIALAGSKQCGRSDLLAVDLPVALNSALTRLDKGHLSLIPWEKERARTIGMACETTPATTVNVFIGPEGGWDESEIAQAQACGVIPVRLGPTLLRTETAGIVAATLVLREFGIY